MYSLDGQKFGLDQLGLQQVLTRAYRDHVRPMCLCSMVPVPVYIACFGGTFVLTRMPCTGGHHAVNCSHYEPPEELSGSTDIRTAISEDPDTGLTKLDVDFSLSCELSRPRSYRADAQASNARSTSSRLSLRGLLQFLWDEAELARWKPAFGGRRSWAVVQSRLLRAAATKILRGQPLTSILLVPEPFTVDGNERIAARRSRRLVEGFGRTGPAHGRMIVIGEVKSIVPHRSQFHVVLRHLPDLPFLVDADTHRRMARDFEGQLSLWRGLAEVHLVMAATFSMPGWARPAIDEMTLLLTSAQWIPADDDFELQLINHLVHEGRSFRKAIYLNAKVPSHAPSSVLLDTSSAPIGLALDRRLDGEGISQLPRSRWTWRVNAENLPR